MKLNEPPLLDRHWEGYELAADDTHRFIWIYSGFNLRLIAVPKDDPESMGYDHGWCYPHDPQRIAAAVAAWNPDTQDEPDGWHKRATDPPRRAPRPGEGGVENRRRCHHGSYLTEPCRTVVCRDRARGGHREA